MRKSFAISWLDDLEAHHEFHYTGLTARPEEALRMALDFDGEPFVITDSGDNTTSGAPGWNTFVLRQFLNAPQLEKRSCLRVSAIPRHVPSRGTKAVGETLQVRLGVGYDELSEPVPFTAVVKAKATWIRVAALGQDEFTVMGHCVSLTLTDRPITVIVTGPSPVYCHNIQF